MKNIYIFDMAPVSIECKFSENKAELIAQFVYSYPAFQNNFHIDKKVIHFLISNDTEIYVLDKDSEPLIVGKEFAHGYLTIEPNTIFTYAVEGDYNPDTERSIVWKDVDKVKQAVLDFIWTDGGDLTISDKDKNGK